MTTRQGMLLKAGLIVCAGLVSCSSGEKPVEAPPQGPPHVFRQLDVGFSSLVPGTPLTYLLEVDSCQYVVVARGEGVAITHKANCPNHDYTSVQYPKVIK